MEGLPGISYRLKNGLSRPPTKDGEESNSDESWSSRPSTRDSVQLDGRYSTDSGAGSLDDFHRRDSTPLPTTFLDFWEGVRRHTAPPRKSSLVHSPEDNRPNTVHAWNVYPTRTTMSRYTPLPAIGIRPRNGPTKYCFQEDQYQDSDLEDTLEPTIPESRLEHTEEDFVFRRSIPKVTANLSALSMDSEVDSDFEEDSESGILYASDEEDEEGHRVKKPLVRSATFTIEDRKPENVPRMLLAVRLPDGSRVSGEFDIHDSLRNLCEMALRNFDNSIDNYELVTTEVPKRIFSDFSMTLQSAGLQDKTLLNLQVCKDT